MRLVESTRNIAEGRYNEPVVVDGDIEELSFIATELERMRRQVAVSQANLKERLSQSEQLRSESERLATIGSLAASLAHEIRNPLNAMSLLLTRLKTLSDESLRVSMVDDLFGEVRRLDRLVSSILDYARPVQLSKSSTNIKDLLSSVRDLFQSLGETKGVSIKVNQVDDLFCDVDSDKLKQCLVNLVKNSLDAIQSTGEVKLSAVAIDSEMIQITVEDNGSGIEADVQK